MEHVLTVFSEDKKWLRCSVCTLVGTRGRLEEYPCKVGRYKVNFNDKETPSF